MKKFAYKFYVGIDISKLTLDFTITNEVSKLFSIKVNNNISGFNKFKKECNKQKINLKETLFCCENTGIYTFNLTEWVVKFGYDLWVENPIKINKTQGFLRGKNDSVDSLRIAEYAKRFEDQRNIWKPKNEILTEIKNLLSLRERLLNNINSLKNPLSEMKLFYKVETYKNLENCFEKSLKSMKKDLKDLENKINELISNNTEIKKKCELIESVPSIGRISSIYLLVYTENFENIKTYRECACYAGIAPFENSSGTSIKGKVKVSHFGNKRLKKLLHMCSLSVLRNKKGRFYEYYEKKKSEGKNTMSVLNGVRNKLLNTIFACVKNNKLYDTEYLPKAS